MQPIPSLVRPALAACFLSLAPAARATDLLPARLLPGDLAPAASAGVQQNAEVARGGDAYLVVWEDARAAVGGTVQSGGLTQPSSDVYAMRFDADGAALDAGPIVVARGPFHQVDPRVAWNGVDWLVVWTSRRATASSTTRGIYGARVSASGALLDATPIAIEDDDDADEHAPAIASDGSSWAVIYQDLEGGESGLFGAVVAADGSVTAHKTIGTSTVGVLLPTNARIAFAGGRYLVVSEHYTSGAPSGQFYDVHGRFFGAALDPLAAEFPIDAGVGSQVKASVASSGSQFFVAWNFQGNAVEGTPVAADGTVLVPGGATIHAAPDSSEPSAAWDGSRWVVAIDGAVGPIRAAYVDASGQVAAGSPFVLEDNAVGAPPILDSVVAGGAGAPGRSLVLWTDSRTEVSDLVGRTLDAGSLGPAFALAPSPSAQHHPDLAGDLAHGYLVVFTAESSGSRRVCAQRVDGAGLPVDAQPTVLASGGPELGGPRVAFDGSTWLVAWHRKPVAGGAQVGIRTFVSRVAADGAVIDATPIDALAGETPDVAALGGAFLVVASEEPVAHVRTIRSARVRSSDGALLDASPATVGPSYALAPRVEALGARWLVVWQRKTTHDSPHTSIRGAFVGAGGLPEPSFIAGAGPFAVDGPPALAVLGQVAELAWDDGDDVRARRIAADGALLDPDLGVVVGAAPNDQSGAAIGADGTSWLAAWNDYRLHDPLEPGLGDVYAGRVDAAGTPLDAQGLAVAADPVRPEGAPAVAGDAGMSLVAYSALRAEPPYASLRIEVRAAATSSAGSAFCFGDGSATACPCGNASAPGAQAGCLNSAGTAARLAAVGGASLSADTLRLVGTGMPAGNALYLQGTTVQSGGLGVVLGDGVRCVGGTLVRLGAKTNAGGASVHPAAGDLPISVKGAVLAPGTRTYQVWYRDTASFCGPDPYNLSNAVEIVWGL